MPPDDDRLAALERQVAALTEEVTRLRADRLDRQLPPPSFHRDAVSRASAVAASIKEEEIESVVGRYGTLLLGAFVLLMGVGVLIQFAVTRGLLTPEVRVGLGALTAASVGAVGVYFHRRGEVRYANVLLALALALVDLVAWGAGPRLHLVSTTAALSIVDAVAIALAALAVHDESEFLFCVAVAGALSSPFATMERLTDASPLLGFGAVVIVGSLRAVRRPEWTAAFVVLVTGAQLYALAAMSTAAGNAWYASFLVSLFAGGCTLGALLLAPAASRGGLSRGFLFVGLFGVIAAWDRVPFVPRPAMWAVALGMAAVTHWALAIRHPRQHLWTASALLLPVASLGIVAAGMTTARSRAAVLALWALFSLAAWHAERRRGEGWRGGAHLTSGALLGSAAALLFYWPQPLPLVAMLAGWGMVLAWLARVEERPLPLLGVAVALGTAALSAMDQLASRQAYAYAPFATRSSLSALAVTVGLAGAGALLAGGSGVPSRLADRAVRLGVLIGFAILWGRLEVGGGWSPDVAAFLLIVYYAACGVGSIVAGRRYGVRRLRLAGLGLAIYAAVKAVVQTSEIGELMLRVGAYGAVGVFLLTAGYIYREAGRSAA